jgi:hypothetical protein
MCGRGSITLPRLAGKTCTARLVSPKHAGTKKLTAFTTRLPGWLSAGPRGDRGLSAGLQDDFGLGGVRDFLTAMRAVHQAPADRPGLDESADSLPRSSSVNNIETKLTMQSPLKFSPLSLFGLSV